MSLDADPGFWKQAAAWLWTLLLLPMGALWTAFNHRLAKIEKKADAALPRIEFDKHQDRTREDLKELFAKAETNKDVMNTRVENVRESVERKIDDLRRDVNGGFNAIRDEIRQLKN